MLDICDHYLNIPSFPNSQPVDLEVVHSENA